MDRITCPNVSAIQRFHCITTQGIRITYTLRIRLNNIRHGGLTWSQQSTSPAMTSECVFILVRTTVQNASLGLTVPVLLAGVEGVAGLPEGGGAEREIRIS